MRSLRKRPGLPGGGIGYDFSTIRPKGAAVNGVAADASGPLSFMDVWDAMCRTIMSAGSRRGAMMATMRCDHPDIEDFINWKVNEEKKVAALIKDGYSSDFNGEGQTIGLSDPEIGDHKRVDPVGNFSR